jgi:hypothetical protein
MEADFVDHACEVAEVVGLGVRRADFIPHDSEYLTAGLCEGQA